jgi:hypothetical protein
MNSKQEKQRAKQIQREIRNILVNDWNPIGFPVPEDEYDGYIGHIYHLLYSGASKNEIAKELNKWGGDFENLLPVAEKLLNINVRL